MSLEICFKYFFLTPLGQRAAPWLASQTRRWRYLEIVVGQEKRFSICFPLAVCAEAACHMSFSPISLHPFQNHYPYYFHLSLRATHTRPRHPAALASVRSGIVLVQVRVRLTAWACFMSQVKSYFPVYMKHFWDPPQGEAKRDNNPRLRAVCCVWSGSFFSD